MVSKNKKDTKVKKGGVSEDISNFKKSRMDFRELSEIDYDIYRFFH